MKTPSATGYMTAPTKFDAKRKEDGMYDSALFTTGKWEVELRHWRKQHCIPNGWMVSCCPCVSLAQISARIGVLPFKRALWRYGSGFFFCNVLALSALVFYYIWLFSVYDDDGSSSESTAAFIALGLFSASLCGTWFLCKLVANLRTQVRARFQIQGTENDDCCAAAWCTNCVIGQMAIQVKSFTPGSCDFQAPEELPAYIP